MFLPAQDGRRSVADIFGLLLFSASLFDLIGRTTPGDKTQKGRSRVLVWRRRLVARVTTVPWNGDPAGA